MNNHCVPLFVVLLLLGGVEFVVASSDANIVRTTQPGTGSSSISRQNDRSNSTHHATNYKRNFTRGAVAVTAVFCARLLTVSSSQNEPENSCCKTAGLVGVGLGCCMIADYHVHGKEE